MTLSVSCRSCGREIRFRRQPTLGSRLTCPACGTKLEILGLAPIEVDWAFDEPLAEAASDLVWENADADGEPSGGAD